VVEKNFLSLSDGTFLCMRASIKRKFENSLFRPVVIGFVIENGRNICTLLAAPAAHPPGVRWIETPPWFDVSFDDVRNMVSC
jgi:hypothetical protein